MGTLKNLYSDIDLTFSRQPITGDVSLVLDDRSIIASVKNLLFTNFYERLWQPDLGSNMTAMLFENITVNFQTIIEKEIRDVINNYEPRVRISNLRVTAEPEHNGYNVFLSVYIANNTTPTDVRLFLERTR